MKELDRKIIGLLALIQILLIVGGLFLVTIALKINGYPHQTPFMRYSSLAIGIRDCGLVLLLVPAAWSLYALLAEHYRSGLWSPLWAAILGPLVTIGVLCLILYATATACRRPLLIHTSPKATTGTSAAGQQ